MKLFVLFMWQRNLPSEVEPHGYCEAGLVIQASYLKTCSWNLHTTLSVSVNLVGQSESRGKLIICTAEEQTGVGVWSFARLGSQP